MKEMLDSAFKGVDQLPRCTTREQVEKLFADNGIADVYMKREILIKAMQVEETFNTPANDAISPEQEYEYELESFLIGSWRFLGI